NQRSHRYQLLRELYRSETAFSEAQERFADRLHPVTIPLESAVGGRRLVDLGLEHVAVTALVREGERMLNPSADTPLQGADVLVLFGAPDDLKRAEAVLLG